MGLAEFRLGLVGLNAFYAGFSEGLVGLRLGLMRFRLGLTGLRVLGWVYVGFSILALV